MLRFLAILFTFILLTEDAQAQSSGAPLRTETASMTPLEERAQDVVAIFNGEGDPLAVFAPVFLDAIPAQQIATLSGQLTQQFGPALGVEKVDARSKTTGVVTIRMERAIGQVNLSIDPADANRINGLRLLEFTPTNDTLEKVKADIRALDGNVSAYFGPLDGKSATISINPDAQMPLGSAMKLYVLGALGAQIQRGERSWSDVVELDAHSFPSGQLQNWPIGSPVTLHSLASLMISISDNTATDQLIALLGREEMARYLDQTGHSAPERNAPWITTRELFLIKGAPLETIEAYAAGSPQQRETIRRALEENPAGVEQINARLAEGPVAIDTVEWFANTSDLARLFSTMRAKSDPEVFRIMAINPALPASVTDNWDYVGFKGGSETGVLNMTWLLKDKQGQERMLTLSWSNTEKAVETQTLLLIAQRILSLPQ